MKYLAIALALAAFATGSLKAKSVYEGSAFGSNPLQSPPTVPIRIENGGYDGYR
jgi:hypothetical protein